MFEIRRFVQDTYLRIRIISNSKKIIKTKQNSNKRKKNSPAQSNLKIYIF